MVHLERLILENNKIEKVPKGLGKLPKLLELDLARNKLESFPSAGFGNLEWIDLSKNRIKSLPDMSTWTNIKTPFLEGPGLL